MLTPMQIVSQAREAVNECDNKALCQAIDDNKLIIDVREPDEYSQGYIANAINIPRGLLEFAIFDHPKVKPLLNQQDIASSAIWLYCKSGGRSALAAQSLQNMGFQNVHSLKSGIAGWQTDNYKISREDTNQY